MHDAPYRFPHRARREASDTDANSPTNTIAAGSGTAPPTAAAGPWRIAKVCSPSAIAAWKGTGILAPHDVIGGIDLTVPIVVTGKSNRCNVFQVDFVWLRSFEAPSLDR